MLLNNIDHIILEIKKSDYVNFERERSNIPVANYPGFQPSAQTTRTFDQNNNLLSIDRRVNIPHPGETIDNKVKNSFLNKLVKSGAKKVYPYFGIDSSYVDTGKLTGSKSEFIKRHEQAHVYSKHEGVSPYSTLRNEAEADKLALTSIGTEKGLTGTTLHKFISDGIKDHLRKRSSYSKSYYLSNPSKLLKYAVGRIKYKTKQLVKRK